MFGGLINITPLLNTIFDLFWLAIADKVRTRIASSDKDIFVPELSF